MKYHALPDTIINEFKEQYKKDPRTEKLTNPFLYQPK